MQLNILAIGDIVGQPGRKILEKKLRNFIKEQNIDFCIANAENAAGGSGITVDIANKLFSYDVNAITMGIMSGREKKFMIHYNQNKGYSDRQITLH